MYYHFVAEDAPDALKVTLLAGETGPVITGGVTGNIETVGRPGRDALTVYTGSDPVQMDLPVLLEGWQDSDGTYVEGQIRALQKMAGFDPAGDRKPYPIKVGGLPDSTVNTNPFPNKTWFISALSYGEHIYNNKGDRVRQYITVSLIERIEDRGLTAKSLRTLSRKTAPIKAKIRKGESLRQCIRRVYGKQTQKVFLQRVREAKKMNQIEDAHKKFKKPREVLLPPRG